MIIGRNIRMICFKLNWFFYGLSRMLQFSQFVWTQSYSVWDVFNNFLLIDATDRSNISSDQKRFFLALSLYPLSFFADTPFKGTFLNRVMQSLLCYENKCRMKIISLHTTQAQVVMHGKLIAVTYTLRTYWNQEDIE